MITARAAPGNDIDNDDENVFCDTQFQEERTQSQVDDFVYQLSFFCYILHICHICAYLTYCAYLTEHGSGREGGGGAAVVPAAGITSVFQD